jgi:hypothetical protein
MKLLQVRLGFATNSSSTHSIVFMGSKRAARIVDKFPHDEDENSEFGWGYFTLSSEEAKLDYLAQTIVSNLRVSKVSDWMGRAIAQSITNRPVKEGHVDHQSILTIPRDWDNEGLDEDFVADLKKFIIQPGVVILGGNDNDNTKHPLSGDGQSVLVSLPREPSRNDTWIARKDGQEWTLFDRAKGNKVTISFTADDKYQRQQPSAPELVDIKVTDFCPFLCSYCYQGSVPEGKHADKDFIRSIAYECKQAKVFECALGGGEPTLWPHFVETLQTFQYMGVMANFTTRNVAWLRDEDLRPQILEHCGAFAVSVDKFDTINELADKLSKHKVDTEKVTIHYTLGASNEYEPILRAAHNCGFKVTLLGWKTTGRGSSVKPKAYSDWLQIIQRLEQEQRCPQIGIDTVVAQEFEKEIKAAGIPDYLFYTQDGKFSFYVDGVNQEYGESSFCGKSFKAKGLIDAWQKIGSKV